MRSALTVLGILIGIAAVMLTVGLGQGAQQQVASQIGKLGSNLLIVSPGSTHQPHRHPRRPRLGDHPDDARTPRCSPTRDVAPDIARGGADLEHAQTSLAANGTNWTTTRRRHDARLAAGARPHGGRRAGSSPRPSWTTAQPEVGARGDDRRASCSAARSPVGPDRDDQRLQPFTVIGVLDTVGSTVDGDEDDQAVVPADDVRHAWSRRPAAPQRLDDLPRGHRRRTRSPRPTRRRPTRC